MPIKKWAGCVGGFSPFSREFSVIFPFLPFFCDNFWAELRDTAVAIKLFSKSGWAKVEEEGREIEYTGAEGRGRDAWTLSTFQGSQKILRYILEPFKDILEPF